MKQERLLCRLVGFMYIRSVVLRPSIGRKHKGSAKKKKTAVSSPSFSQVLFHMSTSSIILLGTSTQLLLARRVGDGWIFCILLG